MNNTEFIENVLQSSEGRTSDSKQLIPFENYLGRFTSFFQERVLSLCGTYNINNKEQIAGECQALYYNMIHHMALRTLIYELHLSKENDLFQDKNLSSEEFYAQYCSQFDETGFFCEFCEKYSVLTEKICTLTTNTLTLIEEVFQALSNDRDALIQELAFYPEKLEHISFSGDADSHNHGKKAILLETDNVKVIYKPHSLGNDIFFTQVFSYFSERLTHDLKTLRVIERGEYGWQEFAVTEESASNKETLYYRYGEILAITFSLAMGDLHKENLFFCGEYPIIIDTETMIANHTYSINKTESNPYINLISKMMQGSVFETMLLPMNLVPSIFDIDISPLSVGKKQTSQSISGFTVKNAFTDEICLEKEFYTEEATEAENAFQFMPQILDGFTEAFQVILSNQSDYKAFILSLLNKIKVRIRQVMRPTYVYAKFFDASLHPDYLDDPSKQLHLIQKLKSSPYKNRAQLSQLADIEIISILNGDIPYFYQPVNECSLCSIYGNIENFFDEDIVNIIIKRIESLSEDTLREQQRLIRLAMSTLLSDCWDYESEILLNGMQPYNPHLRSGGETAVLQTVDYFCKAARWDESHKICLWFGHIIGDELKAGPITANIYDGGGSVWLLARMAYSTGKKEYLSYVDGALKAFELAPTVDVLSAFNGIGSLLYLYYSVFRMWHDKKYYEAYEAILNRLCSIELKDDICIDYCGGLAGMIVLLGRIYQYERSEKLLQLQKKYMDFCMQHAEQIKLNGLAHGYSGLILATAVCVQTLNAPIYSCFLHEMCEKENSTFDLQTQNWKDLRYENENCDQIYWCHGAAGIALSRLEAYKAVRDERYLSDIDRCIDKIESTWETANNHSLCHGKYGIMDCLEQLKRELPQYNDRIQKITNMIYDKVEQEIAESGVKCGMANTYDMFSFMLGITGMAYSIMRHIDHTCPSVLILEV